MDDSPFSFGFASGDAADDSAEPDRRPRTARPSTSTGGRIGGFGTTASERLAAEGQPFGPLTSQTEEDSSDEESPFAFAPPPSQPHVPSDQTFAGAEHSSAAHHFDHNAVYDASPSAFDPSGNTGHRSFGADLDHRPLDRPLSPRAPSIRYLGPSSTNWQSSGSAHDLERSHDQVDSALSPAATFAQKVQVGAPDWFQDEGFTRDTLEAPSASSARRRVRERREKSQRTGRVIDEGLYDEHKRNNQSPGPLSIPLDAFVPALRDSSTLAEEEEDKGRTRTRRPDPPRTVPGVRAKKRDLLDLEDSPYPAVQGSVSNIDDHEAVVVSLRTWLMGFFFCVIFAALNTFFNLRYPAPLITPIITQLLAYPLGKYLAKALPSSKLHFPTWLQSCGLPEYLSLNPGPFSIKEHTLLTIMANIGTPPAFGLNYSLVAEKGYGQRQSVAFDILLVLSTQVMGFGAAGLSRRFLVWPAAMIWPQNLVYSTVLNTLHAELDDEEPGVSRFRFFVYVIVGAFCWFWLPGFLFTALSAFSWVCWIVPDNVVVNQLFGVASGLGMGILTFDWSQITYVVPPLVSPWWAQVNVFAGFVVAMWVVAPALYYSNVWNMAYLPLSTTAVFDRFGQPYNSTQVIDPISFRLNETAYAEYSPIFLPAVLVSSYGTQFVLATAVLVYTALYHGPDLWHAVVTPYSNIEEDDVHMRLMRNYKEVPDWWYGILLVVAVALSLIVAACWDTSTPAWAMLVAFVLGLIYFIPSGIIFAITGFNLSMNLIVEMIAGYMMKGLPLANILFKTYCLQVDYLGLYYAQDLKLAHYQKIPPRVTFTAQISAVIVTAFVQVGVKRWLVAVVPDLCSPTQSARLSCPSVRSMISASTTWGIIGPARLFGIGKTYNHLLFGLLIGAVLPVMTWLLMKRYPRSWLVYVNIPVVLVGVSFMPPATGINYSAPLIVGFIFQYVIRHRNFEWWSKYNFLLSGGMDAGTVLSAIIIFLSLQLPKGGNISLNWWGNEVYANTVDWAGTPYKTPPPEGFGPPSW